MTEVVTACIAFIQHFIQFIFYIKEKKIYKNKGPSPHNNNYH